MAGVLASDLSFHRHHASRYTWDVEISNDKVEDMQTGHCGNKLSKPMMLSCVHSICGACIDSLMKTAQPQPQLSWRPDLRPTKFPTEQLSRQPTVLHSYLCTSTCMFCFQVNPPGPQGCLDISHLVKCLRQQQVRLSASLKIIISKETEATVSKLKSRSSVTVTILIPIEVLYPWVISEELVLEYGVRGW